MPWRVIVGAHVELRHRLRERPAAPPRPRQPTRPGEPGPTSLIGRAHRQGRLQADVAAVAARRRGWRARQSSVPGRPAASAAADGHGASRPSRRNTSPISNNATSVLPRRNVATKRGEQAGQQCGAQVRLLVRQRIRQRQPSRGADRRPRAPTRRGRRRRGRDCSAPRRSRLRRVRWRCGGGHVGLRSGPHWPAAPAAPTGCGRSPRVGRPLRPGRIGSRRSPRHDGTVTRARRARPAALCSRWRATPSRLRRPCTRRPSTSAGIDAVHADHRSATTGSPTSVACRVGLGRTEFGEQVCRPLHCDGCDRRIDTAFEPAGRLTQQAVPARAARNDGRREVRALEHDVGRALRRSRLRRHPSRRRCRWRRCRRR